MNEHEQKETPQCSAAESGQEKPVSLHCWYMAKTLAALHREWVEAGRPTR